MAESREQFAYDRVAGAIEGMIEAGTLLPGDRLPSVRQMSRQWAVSIPTVLHAYRLLEGRRRIRARSRSGFYVLPSATGRMTAAESVSPAPEQVAISDLIVRVIESTAEPDLIPLGTALPAPELLPSASLARHLGRAVRREAERAVAGAPPSGLAELRREIARRGIEGGVSLGVDDVVVTCGCLEALILCLRSVAEPGDTIAIESPTYYGTLQAMEALHLRALEIPMDPATGLSLEALEPALDRGDVAAVVVTPNVHNPLGSIMPEERKRALVDLLTTHDVPAIEDQTYAELHFATTRPRSLQAYDRKGMVVACGSFSKTLASGYRVGWVASRRHRDDILHYKLATTFGTPVPTQLAIAEYLSSGAFDPHLRRLRRTFQDSTLRVRHELLQRLPAGTLVSEPAGGLLLWVRLPGDVDAVALQRQAAAHGLSLAPGPAFSASGGFASFIRVNAGYGWSERTQRSLDLLAKLVG